MDDKELLAGLQALALRHIAELAAMRIAITSLARQTPDAALLLADFEQAVEEQRHAVEVRDLKADPEFERAVAQWSKWLAAAGKGPLARD